MKKAILSIAFLCYFAMTSGVIVNFHYCMNRLASTGFYQTESKECDRCGMTIHKSHGCCRDDVKVIKMNVDQKVTSHVTFELSALDAIIQAPSAFIDASFINTREEKYRTDHSPPLFTGQDTYLQNCVFRI